MSKKILVPVTSQDCEDLINGEEFDWNFGGKDLHLFNPDTVEGECPRCIEDYEDEETGEPREGTSEPSFCPDCGICEECEHLSDCQYSE